MSWLNNRMKADYAAAPEWLSGLSVWLLLRSRSCGSWVWVPRRAVCWQLRAWSLPWILCLPCSAHPCTRSVSLSEIFNVLFSFERDRACAGEGQRAEGDPESKAGSRLWAVGTETDTGLELANHEITTWAEGRQTDWATQASPQKRQAEERRKRLSQNNTLLE